MKKTLFIILFVSSGLLLLSCKKKETTPTPTNIVSTSGSSLLFEGVPYSYTTTSFTSGTEFKMSAVSNKFPNASLVILFPNGTPSAGSYPINSINSNDVSIQITDSTGIIWYADSNSVRLNVSVSGSGIIASFSNVVFAQFLYDSITTKASGQLSE
jgi:hypothetical protein